jgi:hypothetical protein
MLSIDWVPVKLRRGTTCGATLYQRSILWGCYTALMGQLHCIVGIHMHQRLQNCSADARKQFCSVRAYALQRVALTVIRSLAGRREYHYRSLFDSSTLSNTQSVKPDEINHALLQANLHVLGHTKIYMQNHLKNASTYNEGLVHKLARPISYLVSCVHNRNIELTFTCTDVIFTALARTNSIRTLAASRAHIFSIRL